MNLVLLGDPGVGKTALSSRYTEDKFISAKQSTTIGIGWNSRIEHIDGIPIKVTVTDTAGMEQLAKLTTSYYRNAHGALLVFDLTNVESLQNLTHWITDLYDYKTCLIKTVLVGNKSDKEPRTVTEAHISEFAKQHNIQYYEVSAQTGDGVRSTFRGCAESILETLVEINEQHLLVPNENRLVGVSAPERSRCCCRQN